MQIKTKVWERMTKEEQIELSLIIPLYTYKDGEEEVHIYSKRSLFKRKKLVEDMNEKYLD